MNQEPIGLWGGTNLYQFAPNTQIGIDPLGLSFFSWIALKIRGYKGGFATADDAVAYYYTHGAYDSRYDNENFSDADENYASYFNIYGYVGTPG